MSIKQFIPEKQPRALFQATVDLALYRKLLAKLKANGVKRQQFIEAAIKQYLEEV